MRLPGLGPMCLWKWALGAVLAPIVLWTAVLIMIPTSCARNAIATRLSAASGRQVHLGGVHLGWLGEVSLADLRIGAPDSSDDPWLRVRRVTINVGMRQLLFGQVDPTEIEVAGARLRILRRSDGTLELGDLVQQPDDHDHASEQTHERDIDVRVRDAEIIVIDEPTHSRLELESVEARATCKGRVATIHELTGVLNGGNFALAAMLDRTERPPVLEAQLKARDVVLDDRMNALNYLVPVLAGTQAHLAGKLSLDFFARGQGNSRAALEKSLTGHGVVALDPIVLDGSNFLEQLARFIDLPPENRAGSVKSNITIGNGRMSTDNLTLDVARVPVVLAGWTDFRGQVDYRLRSDRLTERLPAKAREFLADLAVKLDDVADLEVSGSIDALRVTIDGVAVKQGPGGTELPDDATRLREVARRIRERLRH